MADFKTADICGASPNLNSVLEKMDSLKSSLSSSLTVDPSALSSTLSTQVSSLSSSLSGMIPELPSAPDVSLQAELTGLSNIDLSLPTGVLDYNAKLASIKSQFGDSLTNSGFSLDDLVSQVAPLEIPSVDTLTGNLDLAASASSLINDTISQASAVASSLSSSVSGGASVDICSVVPNFKLPDGATEATEAAAETLMADAPGVAEEVEKVVANANVTTLQTGLATQTTAIKENTLYSKATTTTEVRTESSNIEIVGETKREVQRPEDNFVETTVTRSTTTEIKSESGGEETIVVAERPRVYPKGNYNLREDNSETFFNTAYPEVVDFFNKAKRLNRKPNYRLHLFGNAFPLLEIPYKIQMIFGVAIDDPKCYYTDRETGEEVFRKPFITSRHRLYTNELKQADLTYKREYSLYGSLKLNFSDTKGESTIELGSAQSLAFVRILYSSFGDYDPSFRDASS